MRGSVWGLGRAALFARGSVSDFARVGDFVGFLRARPVITEIVARPTAGRNF
jgi:hypothetical protein